MKKVAIIGVGLMGGSLGIALRNIYINGKRQYEILGIGRNEKKLKYAVKKGVVDRYSLNLKDVKNTDIAVICYPVDMIAETYKKLTEFTDTETIISDIGSIKYNIDSQIKKIKGKNKNMPSFVGCHPMAGTERGGIEYADGNLYKNAKVIITAPEDNKSTKIISKMWKDAGSSIMYMTAAEHDVAVAVISHLPHVVAYSFYNMFKNKNSKNKKLKKVAAGSFRSITRVAKSKADIWEPIFYNNRKNLKILIREFCKNMKRFSDNLENEKKLIKLIEESTYYEDK